MSSVFRAKYVVSLRKKKKDLPQILFDNLFKKNWVVYAKKAFVKPEYVIEYLGRYSHKIAISNHRILTIDNKNNTVTFSLKNYKKDGKKETLSVSQTEFIRRFKLHILPKGFTRIRHYGILSGTWKKKHLKELQEKLNENKTKKEEEVKNTENQFKHLQCPNCKKGTLQTIFVFTKIRPPPTHLLKQIKIQKAQKKHKQKNTK